MSDRAKRLTRLVEIRKIAEELDKRDLELAVAAVAEVDSALRATQVSLVQAGVAARAGLEAGERGEWLLADAQTEVAGWNRGRLGLLRAQRAIAVAPAKERFLESRREHEQVKVLVEDAKQAERAEEDRRAQTASDDWFLGRLVRERRARR
jgi:flagellar biosynthesis chaperone FliJ